MKRGMIFVFIFLFLIIISSIVLVLVYDNKNKNLNLEAENVSEEVKIIFEEIEEPIIEISFIEQTSEYDTSQKVIDLINTFNIIGRDDILLPAKEVYEIGEGTEYDLLRLASNILLNHQIQAIFLVYEYGENIGAAVNFRGVEEPMYYYFEDDILKMKHHGSSFEELIVSEEERLGISVDRYGALFEGDLRGDSILNIKDVEMWKER